MTAHYDASEKRDAFKGVSLFAGGGIGDLALRAVGVDVIVASELLPDRASVFRSNYPNTTMVEGDIRKTKAEVIGEGSVAQFG